MCTCSCRHFVGLRSLEANCICIYYWSRSSASEAVTQTVYALNPAVISLACETLKRNGCGLILGSLRRLVQFSGKPGLGFRWLWRRWDIGVEKKKTMEYNIPCAPKCHAAGGTSCAPYLRADRHRIENSMLSAVRDADVEPHGRTKT